MNSGDVSRPCPSPQSTSEVVKGPLSPIMSKPAIDGLLANPALNPPSSSEDSLASAKKTRVALPSAFTGVDILLVSSPPPSLSLYSTSFASLGFQLATPASPLSDVVVKARPRYMFWADGAGFWEREPFGWWDRNGKEERWTRAVKLGHFGVSPADGQQKPRVRTSPGLLSFCLLGGHSGSTP